MNEHDSIDDPLTQYDWAHINCALLTPEVFFDLSCVLVENRPAGPLFIDALTSLVEACVLHERAIVAPYSHDIGSRSTPWHVYGDLTTGFGQHQLAQQLMDEGVLDLCYPSDPADKDFPTADKIVNHIIQKAAFVTDYEFDDYFAAISCAEFTFSLRGADKDILEYINRVMGIDGFVEIAGVKSQRNQYPEMVDVTARALKFGFDDEEIDVVAGRNERALALEELARAMNMSLYTNFMSAPHFAADLRMRKGCADQLRAKVKTVIEKDGATTEIQVPAMTQILLTAIKDNPKALGSEIARLRETYRPLRTALTAYEQDFFSAKTRDDENLIESRFTSALSGLVQEDTLRTRRWLFRFASWLAPIARGPAVFLEKLTGQQDINEGRRVKGLRSYWNDLWNAPATRENHRLLKRAFPNLAEDEAWGSYAGISKKINKQLGSL